MGIQFLKFAVQERCWMKKEFDAVELQRSIRKKLFERVKKSPAKFNEDINKKYKKHSILTKSPLKH